MTNNILKNKYIMAGYEDTRQKIISTLMGRPVGTEIQPENHQDYALNMLDYIRSLELIATSTLIGVAESTTTPVQPNSSRVCYIAGVDQNQTVVFENFIDENGNPISVTTGDMEGIFIILLWNTQYWSAQTFSTNIISQSESATFYYRYNIRKTYESTALMNADVASPIGTDGKYIKVGDIVTVVNSTTPSENGIYSYEGDTDGWKYQSSFNFQIEQVRSQNSNTSPSSKLFDDIATEFEDFKYITTNQFENYPTIQITGDVTNAADEEDLTSENNLLKIKNRGLLNGMGYIIIRKNKTFSEQLIQANTIYEIRYDFDLNGGEITIPEGCVLEFQGGSIANGVIQGFNTGISTFNNENIFDNVVNKGTWSVKNILSKWWSDKGNGLAESISNMAKGNSCYIEFEYNEEYRYDFIGDDSGLYSIEVPSVYLFEKCGNVEVNLNGSTHIMNPNSSKWYRMFSFLNCENSYIGNGVLIGDRLNHTYNDATDEWGYGIRVIGKRCKIENMNISQFTGDAICVGGFYYVSGNRWIGELYGCQIIGCELHHCRRQGISFGFTRIDSICDINNNNIHDIGTNDGIEGASPMSGIDIEPSTNQGKPEPIAGIFIIENNVIKNCTNNSIISSWGNAIVEQIEINGLETDSILNFQSPKLLHINNLKYDGIVFGSNNTNINAKNELIISNSKFNLLGGKPFYIQKGLVKNCEFVGNKDANEAYSSVLSYNSTNTVMFENCKFKDVLGTKLETTGRYANGISEGVEIRSPYFKFYNCVFNNCSGRFLYERNVEFIDCVIKGGSYWNLWNTKIEGCDIENVDSNSGTQDLVLTKCRVSEDFNRDPYYTMLANKLVLYNSYLKVSTIPDNDTRFDNSTTNCVAYNSELSYDVRHMAAMKNIVAVNSVVQARSDIPTITLVSSSYNKIGYDVNNPIDTERPTIGIYAGYQFYDKTINKPIWYNGTKWIDATGAGV